MQCEERGTEEELTLESDIRTKLSLIPAMLRRRHNSRLALPILDHHHDILPLVLVPEAGEVLDGHVLLEVVLVHVGAVAVVAPGADVDVLVVEVGDVAAAGGVGGPVGGEALGAGSGGVDGGDVVAGVGVVCFGLACGASLLFWLGPGMDLQSRTGW